MLWKIRNGKWSGNINSESGLENGGVTIWSSHRIIIWHLIIKSKKYWNSRLRLNRWWLRRECPLHLEVFHLHRYTSTKEHLFISKSILIRSNSQLFQLKMLKFTQWFKKTTQKTKAQTKYMSPSLTQSLNVKTFLLPEHKSLKVPNSHRSNSLKTILYSWTSNLLNKQVQLTQ